mmetsp:Transcript_32641/g.85670  ORF Transcript_32641/g.85670 Transcript_32641/m.85670 type:complete len:227 (+) Transcript_32641:347-1027(+)
MTTAPILAVSGMASLKRRTLNKSEAASRSLRKANTCPRHSRWRAGPRAARHKGHTLPLQHRLLELAKPSSGALGDGPVSQNKPTTWWMPVRAPARPTSGRRRRLRLMRGPQLAGGGGLLHAPQVAGQAPVEHGVEEQAEDPGHRGGHRERKAEGGHVLAPAAAGGLRRLLVQVEAHERLREEAHGQVARHGREGPLHRRLPGHDRAPIVGGHDLREYGPVHPHRAP